MRRWTHRDRSKLKALITLARHSAVANLANSAGCTLKLPIFIHDRLPLMALVASMGVANSNIMKPMYRMYDMLSIRRSSTHNMMAPNTMAESIHTTCMPLRAEKSSNEVPSSKS